MVIEKLKILIVHPVKIVADLISFLVESEFNCSAEVFCDLPHARRSFKRSGFSIIISTLEVAGENVFDFFQELVDSDSLPFFILIENKKTDFVFAYKDRAPTYILPENPMLKCIEESMNNVLTRSDDVPEEWTRIKAMPLVHFSGLPADVFIQLKSGRFIKLFNRNDKVMVQDIEKYASKGVDQLFLKKRAFHWLVKNVDEVIPEIIKNPGALIALPEMEEDIILADTPNFQSPIELEKQFLEDLHQTSKKVLQQMKKNPELARLLKQMNVDRTPSAFYKNRVDLVCNIACALARELTWSSDAMFEKLIYVAHTHDLTLITHPTLARLRTVEELEETTGLSSEEKKLFLNHPKQVADIVHRDPRAPAEAELIIRQHHELANSKGFPDGLQSARIIPTAALLEISIHFAQYILDHPKWESENYVRFAASKFHGGPFTKIFRALESLLKKKTS